MKKVLTMMLAGMLVLGSTFAFAEDVYVTKNGKKYHKADCLLIAKKGAKPIALEDAVKKDLKPCHKCLAQGTPSTNNDSQAALPKADILASNTAASTQTK